MGRSAGSGLRQSLPASSRLWRLSLRLLGVIPIEPVLVALGAGLLIALGVDARLAPLAPRWWMKLRVPLSLLLGSATLALALA